MYNAPFVSGPWAGDGQAKLLRPGEQQYLLKGQQMTVGQATVSVQLERSKGLYYPWGAAFQVILSGAPGTFEIDIQFSESDSDVSYVSVGVINAVNANNSARYDMPNTVFPLFVRAIFKTWPNNPSVDLLVTR